MVDTVSNIARPSGRLFSVAVKAPAEGGYGVPEGLVFGYPVRAMAPGSIEIVQRIEHGPWAQARIDATRNELLEEREAVKDLIS